MTPISFELWQIDVSLAIVPHLMFEHFYNVKYFKLSGHFRVFEYK